MSVDLSALYERTKKEGVLDSVDSQSSKVDLASLYEKTKKVGVISDDTATQQNNIAGREKPSILDRVSAQPAAANRAFLLGVPNKGLSPLTTEAYMYGRENYKNFPTVQQQALDKFGGTNLANNLQISALGMGADIATDPLGSLAFGVGKIPWLGKLGTMAAESGPGRLVGKALTYPLESPLIKLGGAIKNVATSGKALKGVEAEISALKSLPSEGSINQGTRKGLQILSSAQKSMRSEIADAGKQDLATLTDTFKNRKQFLEQSLSKESLFNSAEAKTKIRDISKGMTDMYRGGLTKAEDALISRGETLSKNDINSVIGKTLDEIDTTRGTDAQDAIRKIIDDKVIPKLESFKSDNLTLAQAKDIKNTIYDSLSAQAKSGSKYFDEVDGATNAFLKNYGELLGQKSPELAQLNSEFAPMAQARRWAMRNFKPFNQNEIQRGADVLKRIASSKNPNQTDINYLKILEGGSGRFSGAGDLRGETTELGKNLRGLNNSFESAKRNLVDSIDFRINQLEQSFKPDINAVKRGGYDQVLEAQSRDSRLQNLTFKREKLMGLRKLRNWAIGLGLAAAVGRQATSTVLRAKGLHSIDIINPHS